MDTKGMMLFSVYALCLGVFLTVSCEEVTTESKLSPDTEDPPCFGHSPASKGRINGTRTICYPVGGCNRGMGRFAITYETSGTEREYIAVAFIVELTKTVKYFREDEPVDVCQTISGLKADDRPEWAKKPASPEELESHLKTHCFTKVTYVGFNNTLPYTTVYKIKVQNEDALIKIQSQDDASSKTFKEETVAYILPRKPEYIVLDKEADLEQICTCKTAAICPFAFGQAGLTGDSDLKSKLDKL